ncbi:2-Hydroxyacid oxidase 2-like isoform X1 [Perognathus longimembris pacificus]|uniref:2-Hydroxyacid oxidase 2-like isoform X1 n=2 Tax=Perognathus longimembris pacificus TaxID=214514 RepID=UPI002019E051|nr:2-Hydroxyacid oxidase 2-like isoform X1 [Perognathus longimembris pacificus]XP_048193417.1 2-Hydroxyacid oxidase 2-like isoform X1 [Perognathus longimembris pacificus]XP_048193421.1 2-Hydroxyacid oxidase 2-like isoform X1 [Perognathus longimembris pacificus]
MPLVCLTDFQAQARERLPKASWDFIEGAADEGITMRDNMAAFKKIRLRPRYLKDVSQVDTGTTIQGEAISAPICIAPTALHCIAWPDGEMSTARAAQAAGVCYITSTYASCTLEDIVASAPSGLRWFQLLVQPDWQLNKQLIQRAESLGFKALVVSVDVPVIGKRRDDLRNQIDLKANIKLCKILQSPDEAKAVPSSLLAAMNAFFCWDHIPWLQSLTRLPIILKGILTREDAELAVKHNVQGILVSNHGGRQLDEVPASIDALAEVVAAVQGRMEVYLDGGVRTGNDVLKALALGAKCIFLGRPILWGLTCKGEKGVEEVLNILKEEFRTSMTLTGCRSIAEINRDLIQLSRL